MLLSGMGNLRTNCKTPMTTNICKLLSPNPTYFHMSNSLLVTSRIFYNHIYCSCDRLLSETKDILVLLDDLSDGFDAVRGQTSTFQRACEQLLSEQRRLTTIADELSMNLEPFGALESITRKLNTPGSDLVLKSDFKEMLSRLDSCLTYVNIHVGSF